MKNLIVITPSVEFHTTDQSKIHLKSDTIDTLQLISIQRPLFEVCY